MIVETLSTFPDMYDSVMNSSMMRIAQEKGILDFHAYDLRDWTHDRHRTTDDDPYGGGAGLVMKCEPLFEAYDEICARGVGCDLNSCLGQSDRAASTKRVPHEPEVPSGTSVRAGLPSDWALPDSPTVPQPEPPKPYTIFLAPQGERFCDDIALDLAKQERLLFICGHYEGIDERAYTLADRVISLGDYVLTSGELASMVVIDAVVRKLPGVLGAEDGAITESFSDGLLEYPQYTRPAEFRGMRVPDVLLSGDHGKVAKWRREQSLLRTARLRPDLLADVELSPADRDFLQRLGEEG